MKNAIVEQISNLFGKTGNNTRPRLRQFHAELLYDKFKSNDKIITVHELNRPKEYIDRIIKYSGGYLKYINDDEIEITEDFFNRCIAWEKKYPQVEESLKIDKKFKRSEELRITKDLRIENALKFQELKKKELALRELRIEKALNKSNDIIIDKAKSEPTKEIIALISKARLEAKFRWKNAKTLEETYVHKGAEYAFESLIKELNKKELIK